MMLLKNKKGSYIVFLTILFSTMLIFLLAAIKVTGQKAIDNSLEDFGNLWGQNILAEYDQELKDRYGFFAFGGNEEIVKNKLKYYGNFTYNNKKYIKFNVNNVDLKEYQLMKHENLLKQVKEIVAFQIKPKYKELNHDSKNNRYINNKWIINGLPSKNRGKGVNIPSLILKINGGETFKGLTSKIVEDLYIFRFFKDYMNSENIGDTYFNNEIEYIISGKLDDEKSRKNLYRKLLLLRNGLNLAYLYGSKEKSELALITAEAITPGPEAVVTQALILETWAFLESLNDVKILYDKQTVPLMKDDESWAMTIGSVVDYMKPSKKNNKGSSKSSEKKENSYGNSGYVKPNKLRGIKYSDYLRIFIAFTPKETKLLRMLDLIQINMKYSYVDTFLISEYWTGLNYELEVNGKKHEFKAKY